MDEKYIPLSAAVDEMKSWEQENKCYHPEDYEDEEQEEPGIPVLEVIERLNSIEPADVRPVVMCRDCKHSYRSYKDGPLRCPKTPTELDEDGFGICAPVPDDFWCKYGEPKDSGADMRPGKEETDGTV